MDLLHRKAQSYKFSNKNGLFCAWWDFNKTFCGISTYHKWMFKLQISSIFNFDRAHQSWISGLLGVKIFFFLEYAFFNIQGAPALLKFWVFEKITLHNVCATHLGIKWQKTTWAGYAVLKVMYVGNPPVLFQLYS